MDERVPVVVVGAGPVGLVSALLLARRGVASVVLDQHRQAWPLPRAVHLDDEAVRVLQAAGVGDAFAVLSRPMPGMRLLDARMRTMAEFRREQGTGPNGWPQANMFDQPDLERVLADAAALEPLVEVRRGAVVTGLDGPRVHHRVDGAERVIAADWVVGCDGAGSLVRRAIGARWRDLGFTERWLVVDGRCASPLPVWGGVHQVCDPRRAVTFMHVVGDRYRWELRLADGESGQDLVEVLPALLAPWTAGVPVELVRHATYTFRARVAGRWRRGRVLIAGDAAHETPPFVGQGIGAGLRDAANLTWKVSTALGGGPDLLDTYEAERRPHVTRVIRAAITVGWALTGGQDRAATTRRLALAGLCRVPGFTARAADTSTPRLPRGPLVRRRPAEPLVGRTCLQPEPGFDDRLGMGWCVVSRGPAASAHPVVDLRRRSGGDSGADPDAAALARLDAWLAAGGAYAVLVRPDRIVAARARTPSEVAVFDALAAGASR